MKKIKIFLACMAMFIFAMCMSTLQAKAQVQGSVSFQFFYDNLSPYGTWVSHPSYGNVWVPDVSDGFRPYFSNGHWVYTNDGWMWASDYDWGWAPFHYGSWIYDQQYRWMWVPGYDWAPAWVTWGYYSGNYGWAPMGPGISFSDSYYPPMDYWVFVPTNYIMVSGWGNHYYVASHNRINFNNNTSITVVKNITVVNNTGNYNGKRFRSGPTRGEYEKASNKRLDVVSVRDNARPGKADQRGNEVRVYRPKVNDADRRTAKPAKVVPLDRMKRTDGAKTREADKKATPAQNNNAREKQQMNRQPQTQQPKPAVKQPQEVRKPDVKPAPQQNSNRREKQQENRQPQTQQPKPEVKQPQEVRKPDVKPAPAQNNNGREMQQQNRQPQTQQPKPEVKQPQEVRKPDVKPAPAQNNNGREIQQQNRQPQAQQPKPEVKQQPREQERKPDINQRPKEEERK